MGLIEGLGINLKLLLAQLVNFLILLLVLMKLVYRPVLKMLDERSRIVKESLEKAKEVEEEKRAIDEKRKEILLHAREEALKIIEEAKKEARQIKEEIRKAAQADAERLIKKAEEQIQREKDELLVELRKKALDLALTIARPWLRDNFDLQREKTLIQEAVSKLKRE